MEEVVRRVTQPEHCSNAEPEEVHAIVTVLDNELLGPDTLSNDPPVPKVDGEDNCTRKEVSSLLRNSSAGSPPYIEISAKEGVGSTRTLSARPSYDSVCDY